MTRLRMMRLDVSRNTSGQWFWRLVSTNGKELCRSSETYTRRYNCDHSARVALDLMPYTLEGILGNGDVYNHPDSGQPPIRVRVLP
jgi:uncharacterized protein YegP (UPF0339 family)